MKHTKERLLHHAHISVFCKPHDDPARVLAGMDVLSPVPTATLLSQEAMQDPERPSTTHYQMKDIELTVQTTPTDEGEMIIYTLFFRRMSWVNAFAKLLRDNLTDEERTRVHEQPASLLDAEGRLSLRLDKELLMQGRVVVVDDGQCYQVKASIAAYPKTEERALEVVARIFGAAPTDERREN